MGVRLPFSEGAAISLGSVIPFADGGSIVDRTTYFPMKGGKTGMMGEAGPEGIFPLENGPGGLGVMAEIGGERMVLPIGRIGGKLGIKAFALGETFPTQTSGQGQGTVSGAQGGNKPSHGMTVMQKIRISTPDADSMRRSKRQVGANFRRHLGRAGS